MHAVHFRWYSGASGLRDSPILIQYRWIWNIRWIHIHINYVPFNIRGVSWVYDNSQFESTYIQPTAGPGYNYCQQYCCLLCGLSLLIILSIEIIIKLSIDRERYNRHSQVAVNCQARWIMFTVKLRFWYIHKTLWPSCNYTAGLQKKHKRVKQCTKWLCSSHKNVCYVYWNRTFGYR